MKVAIPTILLVIYIYIYHWSAIPNKLERVFVVSARSNGADGIAFSCAEITKIFLKSLVQNAQIYSPLDAFGD